MTPKGPAEPYALVITCEHAGNGVPPEYAHLFAGKRARAALKTHRGYDLGALAVARSLGRRLRVAVLSCGVTRLLVDVNRSLGHPRLFSEFSRGLAPPDRTKALERYYIPHRRAVEAEVRRYVTAGSRVLHLSVHSFTPELNGRVRSAEVGLLYDPVRLAEREFCERWRKALLTRTATDPDDVHNIQSDCRIRRNYPYRGASDGLTTALRRVFPARDYLGIELELNQALLREGGKRQRAAALVAGSLKAAI